ncbi:EpsG family protein [Escherichia coli]|uniref:EpsG family protein n=3 Tax=Escherichia coli TaxID=562 RepID=UPI0009C2BB7A|nr:EpsG family protein [Escherichia coli]ARE47191.1 hypothetical protein B6N50_08915 [Escherichia coli C]ATU34593.1 EpsG family protein [Escherichia coli]EAB6126571.1 EpsG family protein [Escherichia coli]EFC7315750.1 EpsG family protein [Escherichia coli]EFG7390908.1 EpsG family protein [Escherichia coli]
MYYLFYAVTILIGALVNKKNKITTFLLFFLMSLFCILRDKNVDRDYPNYYYLWYVNIKELKYYFTEPFSKIIFTYSYELGISYLIVLFVFSSISILPKLIVINRLNGSLAIFLSVYIGYFYWQHDMTQIRVSAALGLTFIAYYYLLTGNKIKSLIITLFAICFHTSAILTGIMYFVNGDRRTLPYYVMIMIFLFAFSFAGLNVSTFIQYIIDSTPLLHKYQFYFSTEWSEQSINVFSFTNISILLITIVGAFYLYSKGDKIIGNTYNIKAIIIALKLSIIGLASIPLLSSVPVAAFRISQVLLFFYPLFLSLSYNLFTKHSRKIIFFFIFIYGIALTYAVVDNAKILEAYSTIL